MLFFYSLAALVVLQSLLSLRGGVRYLNFFRRETEAPRALYMPFASVFVPCRGLDQGLRLNLLALFRQHYPAYELVFVSDRAEDPALDIARQLSRELEGETVARTRFVVAGPATDTGQKVHNLRAAVAEAAGSSEVFVFVDTDARARADWLRALVAPLADEAAGAATGYRWFLPARGGLATALGVERVHRLGARREHGEQLLLGRLDGRPRRDVRAARDERALARHGLGRLRADARVAGGATPRPLRARVPDSFGRRLHSGRAA
jgi:cellulose synthase/poly-beta-1,6-N-acetylglucosamine synthase-like glycosyltransferase